MSAGAERRVTVTRESLYEQVWSKPVRTLAREYGISNVGLSKICRRLDVPRPGPGYWVRLQHGQTPARPPLPPQKEGMLDRATIEPPPSGIRSLVPRAPAAARSAFPAVRVSERLSGPHPAVGLILQSLRELNAYHGAVALRGKDQTLIRVSPTAQRRALLILDAFFKALDAHGHRVTAKRPAQVGDRYSLTAAVGGTEVEVKLTERIGLRERPLRNGERRIWKEYDHIPTGELTPRLGANNGQTHRSWSDGRGKRLEDRLAAAVLGVEEVAQAQEEEERRWEERRRQYREEEGQREIVRLRTEHEQALAKDLSQMAAAWRESRQIRQFLQAVETSLSTPERDAGLDAWAGGCADARDPLRHPETIAEVLQSRPLRESGSR